MWRILNVLLKKIEISDDSMIKVPTTVSNEDDAAVAERKCRTWVKQNEIV
jgi:hypothetical protein